MHLLAVPFLLASLLPASPLPQGSTQSPPRRLPSKTGRITLPPVVRTPTKTEVVVDSGPEAFHRDIIDLRRSKTLSRVEEEVLLSDLGRKYKDPALLAVDLAPRSKSDIMFGLLKVIDRYGDKYHAEKLHFLLLTRPLGQVTGRVMKTVVVKSGSERGKSYLFDYLASKYGPVRSSAVELLPNYLDESDIPELLRLSRSPKSGVRRKALEVLAGIDDPRTRKRIIEVLEHDPVLASEACEAALAHGDTIVPDLRRIVTKPARGREFGYSAFALAKLETSLNQKLIPVESVPHLQKALSNPDSMIRSSCAIALGIYAYRSDAWEGKAKADKLIVDGLLGLVAPVDFVTSLRMLQPLARETLVKFTGRNYQSRVDAWRGWWDGARPTFLGLRQSIAVTESNAARVHLQWTAGDQALSFRGLEVGAEVVPKDVQPYILSGGQMRELIEQLVAVGFMHDTKLPRSTEPWIIDMRVDGVRSVMGLDPDQGEAYHKRFAAVARREMWQRHRDPKAQPDAAAFWRMETKWLAQHPGEASRRLVWHILKRLPTLDAAERARSLDDLQSVPKLTGLITEADAAVLIDVAAALKTIDKSDFRLLEIALLAPGDLVWRRAVSVLSSRVKGKGDSLAADLFRLIGPERVVLSIRHKDPAIAIAAMHDAAANLNHAAIANLMLRVRDQDGEIQRTGIFALGMLRATQAREFLESYEPQAHPLIRREIWGALGRIGGPGVPAILKRAMESPDIEDRLAALGAMSHTQNAELAGFLAARYVTQAQRQDLFSQRAELSLRQIGPLIAVPALRPHLQMEDGPARQRLVLLLGDFGDPMVVRDLIDLLRDRRLEAQAARLIGEVTGVDLRTVNDRPRLMFAWFAENRSRSQSEWFLDSVRAARIDTTLTREQLLPRSGVVAVQELARLLTTVEEPHMRVLVATMLRETTGQDFTRGVRDADKAGLVAIADRYKIHESTVRAAAK